MANLKDNKSSAKTDKNEKLSKRFTVYLYIELIASILFTVLSISFCKDISLLAFPVALIVTGITVYIAYFLMFKKLDSKFCIASLKLIQYLPFILLFSFILRRAGENGTQLWYDIVTVILWLVIFIFSLVISRCMNDKNLKGLTQNWNVPFVKRNKRILGSRIIFEIVDWIDALLQAVFVVLLIQIFILQLYVIPTESMVPTFLVKDRVAVSKVCSGPKFPLTDVGLPVFTKYKRGDIVVVRNPQYKMDRKSEVKNVTSQLVYMLTFTAVNTNTDEYGNPKYDPLVKRVTGEQGEQIVMQDGVLYARKKGNDVFTPVKLDEKFANWDLSKAQKSLLPKIQDFPLSQVSFNKTRSNLSEVINSQSKQYEMLLNFEEERRNYDLSVAEFVANQQAIEFSKLAYKDNLTEQFTIDSLEEYDLFSNVQELTARLMTSEGGAEWFTKFMTSWTDNKGHNRDVYAESNFRLNVMTKIAFGNLVVRYAQLMKNGVPATTWAGDATLRENYEMAEKLNWYIQGLLDSRNMPVFPPNDENGNPQYIPKNCFFMMGDNRFNSLDMRHSYDHNVVPLSNDDELSVQYNSCMDQKYVHQKLIIGKPKFRLWPVNRMGSLHN